MFPRSCQQEFWFKVDIKNLWEKIEIKRIRIGFEAVDMKDIILHDEGNGE